MFYDAPYISAIDKRHPFMEWLHRDWSKKDGEGMTEGTRNISGDGSGGGDDGDGIGKTSDDGEGLFVKRGYVVQLGEGREMLVSKDGSTETGKTERMKADLVIWCTGWVPSSDFFDEALARDLGVPVLKEQGKSKKESTLR